MLVAGVERVARTYSIDESCWYGAYLAACAASRPRWSTRVTLDKDFYILDLTSRASGEGWSPVDKDARRGQTECTSMSAPTILVVLTRS